MRQELAHCRQGSGKKLPGYKEDSPQYRAMDYVALSERKRGLDKKRAMMSGRL